MSNSIDVHISLNQEYTIYVDDQLGDEFREFCRTHYSVDQLYVMIDEKVNRLHGDDVKKICESAFKKVHFLVVPEGEQSKSISQWKKNVDRILKTGVERGTPLLAVGGGVTGDLGGFVAASVLRGIPLIHMPTSLLAMVDSSIGGKTAINHETGKNLIGDFYQPDAVFSDTAFLQTLEQAEWITGMAEILKYAAIRNPDIFDDLLVLSTQRLQPNRQWTATIRESARIKTDIVQEDALESGKRAYLNFGHTFGHALEKVSGYGTISHGEAVFVGMIAAAYFSRKLGHPVDERRFEPFMPLFKKQIGSLNKDTDELIEAMKTDKKVKNKRLRLVLLNEWGSPYIYECTDPSELEDPWKFALGQFN